MTITAGFRREGFVVLAADQLVCAPSSGRTIWRVFRPKIFMHPTLPLALAMNGLREVGRGMPVSTLLEGLLREFAPDSLSFCEVATMLVRELLPRVRELRENDMSRNVEREFLRVALAVGVVGSHGAELGTVDCHETSESETMGQVVRAPDRVLRHYDRDDAWKGRGRDSLAEDCAHATERVQAGIDEDARLGEHDRMTGGNVDVVVVDAAGARRYDATPPRG